MPKNDASGITARLLSVLESFTNEAPELGLSEISSRLELPLSTTHRLVNTMESLDYLSRNASSGKYRLGLKLVILSAVALNNMELHRQAQPHMRDLVSQTGFSSSVGVLYQGQVLYVARLIHPAASLKTSSGAGRLCPAHCCAIGKVLLAYLPREEVEAIVETRGLPAFTPSTVTSPKELYAQLEEVRGREYAVDLGELTPGSQCVAAPVRSRDGTVVAALSVTGRDRLVANTSIDDLARLVQDHAGRLSYGLGHEPEFSGRLGQSAGRRTTPYAVSAKELSLQSNP